MTVHGAVGIVLAGGRSSRMGSPKPDLAVGGSTLLQRVLGACAAAGIPVVVVGDAPVPSGTRQLREDPSGAGPVHALACAVADIETHRCFVLAADLPFLTADALTELNLALTPADDAAVAVDDRGRHQYLLALWWTASLRASLNRFATTVDAPLRALFGDARMVTCTFTGHPPPWWDCDTPQALATARAWVHTATDVEG